MDSCKNKVKRAEQEHSREIVAQWVKNPTSIHEDAGPIPDLPQWSMSICIGRRFSSDLVLVWLWCSWWLEAVAPI